MWPKNRIFSCSKKPILVEFCHLFSNKSEGALFREGEFIRINTVVFFRNLCVIDQSMEMFLTWRRMGRR